MPLKSETSTSERPSGEKAAGAPVQRQYVSFKFFKVRPEWRGLEEAEKQKGREEAASVLETFSKKIILLSYSTLGTRADCDLMLWMVSLRLEDFEELVSALLKTGLGKHLTISNSYISMTKRSMYIDKLDPGHSESRTRIIPGKHKYLFVYPFWKTRDWYLLPWEKRQEMMDEHIRIGSKYLSVKLNTTYSFGLDDQEFVVAFETDAPSDFLDLVMDLRESQGSKYTLRDTPIFTCIRKPLSELLPLL